MLFLYDIRRGAPLLEQVRRKVISLAPFVFSLGIYFVLRSNALSDAVGVNMEFDKFWQRIVQGGYIVPAYFSNCLFPLNLNIWYVIPGDYLSHHLELTSKWIIILLLVLLIIKRGNAAMIFGILWFTITFVPVSNIIPIPSAPMADRYMYLSVIGLCIIFAAFFCSVLAQTGGVMQKTVLTAGITLLLFFCLITVKRNVDWRGDFSLAKSVVRTDPESAFGHYMLGQLFFKRGDLFNAMKEWERTVEIKPNDAASLTQLGNVYQVSNDLFKARALYARAIQANPNHYEAQYNMALISEKLGETADALTHYEVFLKLAQSRDSSLIPVVEGKISALKEKLRAAAGNPSLSSHQEALDGTSPAGKK
jgi:hypothetical protein